MTYQQAGRVAVIKRIIGWIVFIPALLSTIISILGFAAAQVNAVSKGIGAVLADIVRLMIDVARFNTPFLDGFWNGSPVPSLGTGMSSNNIGFYIIYFLIFVGMALNASGSRMSRQVTHIKEGLEDQMILERAKGEDGRTFEELEEGIVLPKITIFRQYFLLYILPVIFIIIGYFAIDFLGW